MKAFYVLCAIVAIALIIFGIAYPLPGKCVNVSEKYIPRDEILWKDDIGREYINGDCYNYRSIPEERLHERRDDHEKHLLRRRMDSPLPCNKRL